MLKACGERHLLSTVLGTEFPGPGTIYLDQTLQFRTSRQSGDTITVTVTVLKKTETHHIVDLIVIVCNQKEKPLSVALLQL